MKVRFTRDARLQLYESLDYIRRDKPSAARAMRQRVETAVRRLELFPESGRRIPEFDDLPHREIIVPPYRLFYRVQDRIIWIVAVWHGAQLPRRPR